MMMPGRKLTAQNGYRYGFNGQEKDDELKGEGNTYNAEYWEYDSRLGRRWNIDPVVKVWLSPYTTFRNNPIFYFDPNGDDDFFDLNGKYIGSVGSTHDIRVITNSKITMSEAAKNVGKNTKLITEFTYFPKDRANRAMLLAVMNFYAGSDLQGDKINLQDSKDENDRSTVFAYAMRDSKDKKRGYYLFIFNGKINENAGQRFNVLAALVHEREHKLDPNTANNITHVNAVIAEMNSGYFDRTTWDFKAGAVTYAAKLLNKALIDDPGNLDKVKEKIAEFNSNEHIQKIGKLFYDEKLKTVGTDIQSEPVIITTKSKKHTKK